MKKAVILLVFVCCQAYGGFEQRVAGARGRAMGGTCEGCPENVWSFLSNPSSLSLLTSNVLSLDYSPQPFGITALSFKAVAVGLPASFGTFGISGSFYGFDLYKETSFSFGYAGRVSKLACGVNITYAHVAIQGYGTAGTLAVDGGVLANISSQLSAGLAVKNMTSSAMGASREKLPQLFSVEISYQPLSEMSVAFDYVKEIGFDPSPRFGLEYWIIKSVALRAGMSEEPDLSSAGIGLKYSFVQFDYAVSQHETLGLTHELSVSFLWGGDHE